MVLFQIPHLLAPRFQAGAPKKAVLGRPVVRSCQELKKEGDLITAPASRGWGRGGNLARTRVGY